MGLAVLGVLAPLWVTSRPSTRNQPKLNQTTNQNSLFRSRDWLSANKGPLFRSRDWLSANQGPCSSVRAVFLKNLCSEYFLYSRTLIYRAPIYQNPDLPGKTLLTPEHPGKSGSDCKCKFPENILMDDWYRDVVGDEMRVYPVVMKIKEHDQKQMMGSEYFLYSRTLIYRAPIYQNPDLPGKTLLTPEHPGKSGSDCKCKFPENGLYENNSGGPSHWPPPQCRPQRHLQRGPRQPTETSKQVIIANQGPVFPDSVGTSHTKLVCPTILFNLSASSYNSSQTLTFYALEYISTIIIQLKRSTIVFLKPSYIPYSFFQYLSRSISLFLSVIPHILYIEARATIQM
eukprot:sb/3466377/